MVEKRVGEWLGPVDWDYDFTQHASVNPRSVEAGVAALRMVVDDGGLWGYSPCDFTCFRVVKVGMFDGWPFWKPTPAIGYIGPLRSVEVAFFYNLHKGKLMAARTCPKCEGRGGADCTRMLCSGITRREAKS